MAAGSLSGPHLSIPAVAGQQGFVVALLNCLATLDVVSSHACGETMGDHDHRFVHDERVDRSLNGDLALGVQNLSLLVEDHDRSILQDGAGGRDALVFVSRAGAPQYGH